MMGKMVKNMIYFVVLLLVVLVSFGVSRQSILHPNEEPSWTLAKNVVFQPYFMLYGEVFADQIDPECGKDPDMAPCLTGRWIPPFVMAIYLLVANILLINLLIAVFNNIFIEVNAISHQVWMFQHFTVVMEYEQKPTLPPPLIFFSHVYFLLKYLKRKVQGIQETYDNGLKLFLDKEDLEQLYDFEEECVEGYFREKETKLQMSTEERIKQTSDRTENIQQKVEDINQKENNQNSSIQEVEFRIRKLEELSEQTLSTLTVIHRFMAAHSNIGIPGVDVHSVPEMQLDSTGFKRMRHASEHSEIFSEVSDAGGGSSSGVTRLPAMPFTTVRRRGPVRSMTEVRPCTTSDSFTTCGAEVSRSLRDNREHGSYIGQDASGSKRSSIIVESEEESPPTVKKETSERLKTSCSLDGEDNTLTEDMLADVDIRKTSGSLGCLDKYANTDVSNIHPMVCKQLSSTHSGSSNSITDAPGSRILTGPERSVTWAEPRIKVIPPTTSGRSVLMAMHTEYTSITDELETMCGLLSPPRSPCLLSPPRRCESGAPTHQSIPRPRTRHASEMSNSEMAAFLEKETLRDAEENDYQLMQDLIQQRIRKNSCSDVVRFDNNAFFMTVSDEEARLQGRLHRSGAFEIGDNQTDADETPADDIEVHSEGLACVSNEDVQSSFTHSGGHYAAESDSSNSCDNNSTKNVETVC